MTSPLAPYRKAVGTLITGLIAGLTWIIGTGANPADWRTWAQFALFLLIAAGTYLSPPNAGAVSTVDVQGIATELGAALAKAAPVAPTVTAAPAPVDTAELVAQLTAVHDQLHADVNATPPAVGEVAV